MTHPCRYVTIATDASLPVVTSLFALTPVLHGVYHSLFAVFINRFESSPIGREWAYL